MPGIAGFTIDRISSQASKIILQRMQDFITHQDFYIRDELFCDQHICATRSHINVIQKEPQPYSKDGIHIWLDGEFYNQEELNLKSDSRTTDLAIFLSLYKNNNDFSFLKQIDGFYSAVIYDSNKQKVHLIIDRYGLRHLYWTVHSGFLIWSSEVKAILAMPDFKPKIDRQCVKEFLEIGYLLEDKTWFENVELLSSGSILTWDIRTQSFKKQHYWWWDQITPIKGKINKNEIADELGRLFIDSVERRYCEEEKMGVALSGGLDSRAILAAIPNTGNPLQVFTFGKKGCEDVRIAAMAAKVKEVRHHIFEINESNWLMPRIDGIWWTDGQMDLMHMHGIECSESIKKLFRVSLNGFAGDLILGGSFLISNKYLDVPITINAAAKRMSCRKELITLKDDYSSLNKTDFFFLQNRVRRFTFSGIKVSLVIIEERKPFYDNKLIEFVYSLPDKLRFNHYIYNLMLLKNFPDFYKKIPWQKTGVSISCSGFFGKSILLARKIKNKVDRQIGNFGLGFNNLHEFTDYPNWIRTEPAKTFFLQLLKNREALYQSYIPANQVINDLNLHFQGKNKADNLCRYLTFEIWLQQVFNKKYRNE